MQGKMLEETISDVELKLKAWTDIIGNQKIKIIQNTSVVVNGNTGKSLVEQIAQGVARQMISR